MNVMTKRGSTDNVVTYEHFCDTKQDLNNIPASQITLGSTAIVLQDTNGMGIYIANSNKEWTAFSTASSSNNEGSASNDTIVYVELDNFQLNKTAIELKNLYENGHHIVLTSTAMSIIGDVISFEGSNSSYRFNTIIHDQLVYFTATLDDDYPTMNYNNFALLGDRLWVGTDINDEVVGGAIIAGETSNRAEGVNSYAQGAEALAQGANSHAEGAWTQATGLDSHAEGYSTKALGSNSHTEGEGTIANGYTTHAEGGYAIAHGNYSHAEGMSTIANGEYQHTSGKYNIADTTSIEIIGNGTSATRSNARTLDWNGNEWLAGGLTAAGGTITIGSTTITEQQLIQLLATLNS